MIRTLLIVAAIALAVLAGLYFTRSGDHPRMTDGPPPESAAPSVEQAAKPAVAKAPEPKAEAPPTAAPPPWSTSRSPMTPPRSA